MVPFLRRHSVRNLDALLKAPTRSQLSRPPPRWYPAQKLHCWFESQHRVVVLTVELIFVWHRRFVLVAVKQGCHPRAQPLELGRKRHGLSGGEPVTVSTRNPRGCKVHRDMVDGGHLPGTRSNPQRGCIVSISNHPRQFAGQGGTCRIPRNHKLRRVNVRLRRMHCQVAQRGIKLKQSRGLPPLRWQGVHKTHGGEATASQHPRIWIRVLLIPRDPGTPVDPDDRGQGRRHCRNFAGGRINIKLRPVRYLRANPEAILPSTVNALLAIALINGGRGVPRKVTESVYGSL